MLRALAVGLLLLATPAVAEPTVLRFSLVAPDGTAWAKELKAFAWDVERGTRGEVTIKLYFSGVAGDDFESLGRLQRGQLEGVEGAQEAAVRLVAPAHVARATPACRPQRVEAAVIADSGVGVGLHVVR